MNEPLESTEPSSSLLGSIPEFFYDLSPEVDVSGSMTSPLMGPQLPAR